MSDIVIDLNENENNTNIVTEITAGIGIIVEDDSIDSSVITAAVNVVSNALSVETARAIGAEAALSLRINSVSSGGGGGTGSVTSAAYNSTVSVLSARIATNSAQMTSANNAISNAVSIVSQALSSEIVNRTSADNALSTRIDTTSAALVSVNNRVSGNSTLITNNSAQMVSADNAISNAVSVETSARTAADNALSIRIDTTSNAASIISAAAANALSAANNAHSLASQAFSIASAVSAAVASVNNRVSANSTTITNNSAQMTSADNALSVRIDTVSNGLSANSVVLSNALSAIIANSAQMVSADNAISAAVANKTISSLVGVSITGALDQQVLTFNSADNKWHASTVAVGTGSVTSQKMSVAIAVELSNRTSADNALSVRIDTQSQAISVLSARVAGVSAQMTSADDANSAATVSVNNRISGISTAVTNNSAQMTSADNTISNAVSVETSARTAADNTLSGRIDTVSNAASIVSVAAANALSAANNAHSLASQAFSVASATSAAVVSVNNRVSGISSDLTSTQNRVSGISSNVTSIGGRVDTNSAQMVSADNAISNAVSIVSVAVVNKTISSLIGVSIAGAIDQQFLIFNSADQKWHASTVAAGAGSVTSQKMSVAIAVELSNRTSADNALSTRIDTASNAASIVSVAAANALSVASNAHSLASQAFSVASAVSAAVVSVNNRVSGISSDLTSTQNRVSGISSDVTSVKDRVSGISSNVTSIAGRVDTNSAQMVSADNAISNAVSVVSAYVNKAIGSEFAGGNISAGSVVINWANGKNQAFSIQGSVAIAAPTGGSAGATYLLRFQQDGTGSRQPTWDAGFKFAITPVLGSVSAIDIIGFYYDGTNYYGRHDTVSVVGTTASVTSQKMSVAIAVELSNRVSADNALSVRVDTQSQAISVISQQVSALSQSLSSQAAALSVRIDTQSQGISVLSQQASVTSADIVSVKQNFLSGLGTRIQLGVATGAQAVNVSTITNVSGLSVSVTAGGTYQVEGRLMYNVSLLSTMGIGLNYPQMAAAMGFWEGFIGQGSVIERKLWMESAAAVGANSLQLSQTPATSAGFTYGARFEAMMNVSATGTVQVVMKTAGAGGYTILKGSYIRAYKIL